MKTIRPVRQAQGKRVHGKTFTERVRAVVAKIPAGKTMTYKQVATKAGTPNAARAVGAIMRKNFDVNIPCHRVIGSDGGMRGYNRGGVTAKLAILRKEKALV